MTVNSAPHPSGDKLPYPAADFHKALTDAIENARSTGEVGALLIMEISNYPALLSINGRKLLEETLALLHQQINTHLTVPHSVFRSSREHFGIILTDCAYEMVKPAADMVYQIIQRFCSESATPLYIVPSIGSVAFPAANMVADDAIDKAYIASKHTAQEYNRYYCAFEEAEKNFHHLKHQIILAHCMQDALTHRKLRLAFQPIINSRTGTTAYHESLLRIINEDGKIISAGPFIPVAEKLGFINAIDELVLEMVVEELKESPHITLAFNLSSMGIENPEWMRKAKKLFRDPELASRAIIEITETAVQKDLNQAAYFISTLQDMGCLVGLDDFGAGHTSFRQLRILPVDIIKIDGSFVRDIVDNPDNRLFVKTLLDISKGFGLKAVAEFVETGEIAKMLMELKVDYMQGNYFCPAVNYRSWAKEPNYA